MRSHDQRPVASRRLAAIACAVALTALAACSSTRAPTAAASSGSGAPTAPAAASSGSGAQSSLPAEAAARLAQALKPITSFPGPTTPISPQAGTRITVITCSATGATCVRVATGAQQAGKILGWNVTVVDGKGEPSVWNAAMSAAVASKTQGIILGGVPPALVGAGLAAAKAAGIPVIYTLGLAAEGATALVAPDRAESGRALADYVAHDSGGSGQVMILHDPEFPELQSMDTAFVAELKIACPGCSVKSQESFTLGAMAQTLPGMVQTAMQTSPGIGYVLAPYDAASTFVNEGVRAAGHAAVKVMGTGGDAPTIESLKLGEENASMGVPAEWIGFQSVDAIARFNAGKPIPAVPVVQGLVVQSNISAVAPDGTYDGGYNYVAAYMKLWGK